MVCGGGGRAPAGAGRGGGGGRGAPNPESPLCIVPPPPGPWSPKSDFCSPTYENIYLGMERVLAKLIYRLLQTNKMSVPIVLFYYFSDAFFSFFYRLIWRVPL